MTSRSRGLMPWVFGDFTLDEERRQLLRAGMPLALEPKAYELLSLLVARQPRALSKNQIHQVLWAGAFVSESALAGLVADLRSVLGDDARRPRFIRTVHGFGYAFCSEAREDAGQPRVFDGPFTTSTAALDEPTPDTNTARRGIPKAEPGTEPDTSITSTVVPPRHRVTNLPRVRLAIAAIVIGLGGVIGWWLVARARETGVEPPRPTLTRLTFDSGLQTQPTWSPDARFIAYASDRSGNLDIWVQPISGGQAVQVTSDPADDSAPAWSPDGQQIAFRSERQGGGIYVVGALGGGERRLAGFGYRPRWSPDGRQLLFTSNVGKERQLDFSSPKHVFLVKLDGTPPREIFASFFKNIWKFPSVAWHPDGERISIWGEHKTLGPGFWTARVPDGEPILSKGSVEPIKKSYWFYWFVDFSWAPSGDALYFTAPALGARVGAVKNVWRVGVDPSTLQWTGQFRQLTNGPGPDAAAAVSADGRRVAFAGLREDTRLWSFALDGAGRIELPGQPLTAAGIVPLVWDISRDGKKLLAVRARVGGAQEPPELAEQDLSTGARRVLMRSIGPWSCLPAPPRWSADTTRVAYVARTADCDGDRTVLLNTQTGEQTHLPSVSGLRLFNVWDFSPDGQWLAVDIRKSLTGITELALLPIASKGAPRFIHAAPDGMDVWDANFSPDGRWLSVDASLSVEAAPFTNVYVTPTSGGPFVQITAGADYDLRVRWSSKETTLYFMSTRGSPEKIFNVWAIRFDPQHGRPVGAPFPVTAFNRPSRLIWQELHDIRIAHDHMVLPISETSGNIWMLENVR